VQDAARTVGRSGAATPPVPAAATDAAARLRAMAAALAYPMILVPDIRPRFCSAYGVS
jgi:hypothetical protein